MGIFDKAKDLAAQHGDAVRSGIDKAADMVDQRTGGKYAQHIDKGSEAAKNYLAKDEQQPNQPQPPA